MDDLTQLRSKELIQGFRHIELGYILISWVFHTMELIGDFSENPAEELHSVVPSPLVTKDNVLM